MSAVSQRDPEEAVMPIVGAPPMVEPSPPDGSVQTATVLSVASGVPILFVMDAIGPCVAVGGMAMPYRVFVPALIDTMHAAEFFHDKLTETMALTELMQLNSGIDLPEKLRPVFRADPFRACRFVVRFLWHETFREGGIAGVADLIRRIEQDYDAIT